MRLIGVSRSRVGLWQLEMNFPDIILSPMVSVSNRDFALWPLTVTEASRAMFPLPESPTWLEVLVTSMGWSDSSWVW